MHNRAAKRDTVAPGVDLSYQILGSVGVSGDHRPISLGGVQQRRLLGLLLSHPGVVVALDQIVEALWSAGDHPSIPERTVQSYVSRIRGVLGHGRLLRRSGGYLIDLAGATLDSQEFVRTVKAAKGRPPAQALAPLADALARWSGPPFGEFAGEPWTIEPARMLHELRATALEDTFAARLALDEHRQIVGDIEAAVTEYPDRAQLVGHLMIALHRSGSDGAAVRAFQRHRRHVVDESGLDPAPMLVELERRILANDMAVSLPEAVPRIRGYELIEPIGGGPHGTVYRARQPFTERVVAVKVIDTDIADDPEFVRSFEARAQRVARIEHPHVNALYDFWRESGGAFLVSRLLDHDLGEARRTDGPWTLQRTTEFINMIGGALASGHRMGIVHGNVRDANILFDESGYPYLADYAMYPTPMAGPNARTSASDCSALASLVWGMLAGRPARDHEYRDRAEILRQLRPDVPIAAVRTLDPTQTGLAGSEGPGSSDVECFVGAWNDACGGSGAASRGAGAWTGVNPYKGLRSFDESDAADFFGRTKLIDDIVDHVHRLALVAIVGPSGCGKSSLVRAGVVPRLREAGWAVAMMRPGEHPLGSLATALEMTPLGRVASTQNVVGRSGRVLVIDQLEELFTICQDEDERVEFLRLLADSGEPDAPFRTIATLRADFLSLPLQDRVLGPLLGGGVVIVPPMTARELDECVRRPAERHGIEMESSLVTQIVADAAARPGSLPLLQFALADLVDRRDRGAVALGHYDDVGGIAGALSRRAETMYLALPGPERSLLPGLIARLVVSVEGQPETSRRVPLRTLSAETRELIAILVEHRLVVVANDPATREPVVELAHESLLIAWPRLQEWIDETRADARMLLQISSATVVWEQGERTETDLYRGPRLRSAVEWSREHLGSLSAAEREFLVEGDRCERQLTDQRDRTLRLVTRLSVGLACLLVLAIVGASIAVVQRGRATRASYDSETKRLLATSAKLSTESPPLALLLALEGSRRRGDRLAAHDALLQTLTAVPTALGAAMVGHPVRRLMFDRSGRRIVAVGDSEAVVVDAGSHRVLAQRTLRSPGRGEPWIGLGPGDTIIVSDGAYDVRFISALTLQDTRPSLALPGVIRSFATASDGSVLAIGDDFGTVRLWHMPDRTKQASLQLPTNAVSLAFSRDASQFAVAEDTAVSVWSVGGHRQLGRFAVEHEIAAVAFTDDGAVIVSSKPIDGVATISALDAATGAERWRTAKTATVAATLAAERPGAMLAADPNGVRRLQLASGEAEAVAASPARSVAAAPDGSSFVVAGGGPTLSFWSSDGRELIGRALPSVPIRSCQPQASTDGRFVACADPLMVWDLAQPARSAVINDRRRRGFLFGNDRLLTIDGSGSWRVIDLRSSDVLERGQASRLSAGGFAERPKTRVSPDGRLVATADQTIVFLVDVRANRVTRLRADGIGSAGVRTIRDVWFSNDGALLLALLDTGDVEAWTTTGTLDPPTLWFAGSRYGRRPLAFDTAGGLALTDTVTGEPAVTLTDRASGTPRPGAFVGPGSPLYAAAFDPAAHWIATADLDGTVRLWDVGTRRPLGRPIPTDPGSVPRFLPGKELRLLTVQAGRVHVWNLDPGSLADAACFAAGRNLTPDEWVDLGPKGEPYRQTCPG